MTLEEFIAQCIATVAARRAQEQADENQQEQDFQALLGSVIASVRSRLVASIPQPLRQFTSYAGERPTLTQLQGYPATWTPCDFKVEASGLALILFAARAVDPAGPMQIVHIRVGTRDFGNDWIEAVAFAATP